MLIKWETAFGDKRQLHGDNSHKYEGDADITLTFPEPIVKLLPWANQIYSKGLKKYQQCHWAEHDTDSH